MKARIELWAGLAIVGAALASTGCIPEPPSLVLTVTTTDDGVDAAPGDGICEATAGVGDCTLRAAVHEANAGDGAQIVLAAGATYVLDVADGDADPDLDVDARVVLRVAEPSGTAVISRADASALVLDVGTDGALTAERVSPGSVRVAGTASLSEAGLYREGTALEVLPGGGAVLGNSRVVGVGDAVVSNEGSLVLLYVEVRGISGSAAVETASGATTAVGASLLLNSTFFGTGTFLATASTPHCVGEPVVSFGRNYAGGSDCAFTAPGDVAPVPFSPIGTWPGTLTNFDIPANAPTIDQITVGTLGCGSTVVHDVDGDPRPTDGDGDTTAACDIGAIER